MLVIGVSGFRGSGKTTVIKKLQRLLSPKTEIITLNADELSSVLGEGGIVSLVNRITRLKNKRPKAERADEAADPLSSVEILFIKGNLPLYALDAGLTELMDVRLFIDTSIDLCLIRRLSALGDHPTPHQTTQLIANHTTEREKQLAFLAEAKASATLSIDNSKPKSNFNYVPLLDAIYQAMRLPPQHRITPPIKNPIFDSTTMAAQAGTLFVVSGPVEEAVLRLIPTLTEKYPDIESVAPFEDAEEHTGKLAGEVLSKLAEGKRLIVALSPDDFLRVREQVPTLCSIYLCPPRPPALKEAIDNAGKAPTATEPGSLATVHTKAQAQLQRADYTEFDHIIIDKAPSKTLEALEAIVLSEALKTPRQQRTHAELLTRLQIHSVLESHLQTLGIEPNNYTVTPLSSLTNASFRLDTSEAKPRSFFVRIVQRIEDGYRITGEHESKNLGQAHELGLYPELSFYDKETLCYGVKFLTNHTLLTEEKIKESDARLEALARTFRRLHDSSLFDNDYPLEQLDLTNLNYIREQGAELPDDFDKIVGAYQQVSHILARSCVKKTPCHNDPTPYNFLHDVNNNIVISDWECSGNNDPFYDLAKLSVEASLTKEEDIKLLESYGEKANDTTLARLTLYKFIAEFHLGIWAKLQVVNENTSISTDLFEMMFEARATNCRLHMSDEQFKARLALAGESVVHTVVADAGRAATATAPLRNGSPGVFRKLPTSPPGDPANLDETNGIPQAGGLT